MKIALVYPRVINQFKSNLFPLGLVYIATILNNKGYNVKIFDSSFDKNLESIKIKISAFNPDLVGVSVTSDLYDNMKDIIEFSKEEGAFTIIGGPHATIAFKECLNDIDKLDVVALGEAEKTIVELVESLDKIKDVKGIAYKKNGEIIVNQQREVTFKLDELPFPNRELLDNYDKYLRSGIIGITLARGCPFNCKFCQPAERKIFGDQIRYRSPTSIADELLFLYNKYNKYEFYICNDLFTYNKKWINEICDKLEERELLGKIRFIVLSRVDLFDEEMARILKKLGVHRVLLGVESGSERVLKFLQKETNLDVIKKSFKIAKKYKIKTHGLFILGSPDETKESLADTARLIDEIKPSQVMLSLFSPLPGTYLYDDYKDKLNITSCQQYDYYDYSAGKLNVKNENVTFEDVIRLKKKIFSKRRLQLFSNAKELISDFIRDRSFYKIMNRWNTYQRCKDFFG
jgi:radical SAM superfamily enzyme YgiQ (UPF0313 family)